MKNLILRYGLYSGAVSAALMLFMAYRIEQSQSFGGEEVYGYGGMILSMLFVYLGVRLFRDKERNGVITFGEAFKVGGLIALISCICYVVTWMVVYEYIMPDFLDKYITFALDKMKASGATAAEIETTTAEMAKYKTMYANPLLRAALTFIEPLPVALGMSLISAAILRKKASL